MKRDAICVLLRQIKDTKGARIDGMGMQAHYHMEFPSIEQIREAVYMYSSIVNEIQFTEFDMQSSESYDGSDRELELEREGARYKELFRTIYSLDKEDKINITGVTFWGTHDAVSWLQVAALVGGGSDGNRPQMPLPFDDACNEKPAFWGIIDA